MNLPDMDEETEIAGQSILPTNINEEEVFYELSPDALYVFQLKFNYCR